MTIPKILPMHGGGTGSMDMLIGLGPVILGGLLIGIFVLMLSIDMSGTSKRRYQSGYRDERPTGARLLFSGKYFELEELLKRDSEEPTRTRETVPADQVDGK